MRQLISKDAITSLRYTVITLMVATFASCEKAIVPEGSPEGNVTLRFSLTNSDAKTRALSSSYFSKLNIMLFDTEYNRVFDKVVTQSKDDEDFGTLSLKLTAGTYWIVAVGHSSKRSATIKSPEVVQFTASEGEKLTDTFCACELIEVGGDEQQFDFDMYRAGAMVQFHFIDTEFPVNFSHVKMDYTGGSANFNPSTLEGITKSSQSERRTTNDIHLYQVFTFPYLSVTGALKMTVSALDVDGTVIRQRTFESIPIARNRITTYTGPFFEEGDGEFTMSDFSFLIHADWEGEDHYEF